MSLSFVRHVMDFPAERNDIYVSAASQTDLSKRESWTGCQS